MFLRCSVVFCHVCPFCNYPKVRTSMSQGKEGKEGQEGLEEPWISQPASATVIINHVLFSHRFLNLLES